jgi:hypothetical protein
MVSDHLPGADPPGTGANWRALEPVVRFDESRREMLAVRALSVPLEGWRPRSMTLAGAGDPPQRRWA